MPREDARHTLPKHLVKKFEKHFNITKRNQASDYINYVFQLILEECSETGVCPIKGIGKFMMYVTFSTKTSRDVIRFKFFTAQTLSRKIKHDSYIFNNLKKNKNMRTPDFEFDFDSKNRINNIKSRCKIIKNKLLINKERVESEVKDEIEKIIST